MRRFPISHPAAQCAQCHAPDGGIGPDLARVGEHTDHAALLESLLIPSARITPGYAAISLRLHDGRTLAGVPAVETPDQLTLRLADGRREVIPRARIAAQTPAASLMPPADRVLKPAEIRDLVAHLASLRQDQIRSQRPALPSAGPAD